MRSLEVIKETITQITHKLEVYERDLRTTQRSIDELEKDFIEMKTNIATLSRGLESDVGDPGDLPGRLAEFEVRLKSLESREIGLEADIKRYAVVYSVVVSFLVSGAGVALVLMRVWGK